MEPYRVTFYEALFFGKQRESSFLKGQHQERGEKKSRGRRVRASSLTSHQARKKISIYYSYYGINKINEDIKYRTRKF